MLTAGSRFLHIAILVRRCLKTILFMGLFYLSARYIHTYPNPMPANQLRILWAITDAFNASDPEIVYMFLMLTLDLITTIVTYRLIMKGWRWIQGKGQQAHD